MTEIKLLIILDTSIPDSGVLPNIPSKEDIEQALQRQKKDYEDATQSHITIVWNYMRLDLSQIPWVNSQWGENYKFISPQWLKDNAKNLGDYYSVAYVFPFTMWQAPAIWGWSMGFYNGYHIQLIRGMGRNNTVDSIYSMYVTFLEELFHGWDECIWYELGELIEPALNVKDFDEDVVHGKRWNYLTYIAFLEPYLIRIFGEDMLKLVIDGTEQSVVGKDGELYHIYNAATLKALSDIGIISGDPVPVSGEPDSGREIVVLVRE